MSCLMIYFHNAFSSVHAKSEKNMITFQFTGLLLSQFCFIKNYLRFQIFNSAFFCQPYILEMYLTSYKAQKMFGILDSNDETN